MNVYKRKFLKAEKERQRLEKKRKERHERQQRRQTARIHRTNEQILETAQRYNRRIQKILTAYGEIHFSNHGIQFAVSSAPCVCCDPRGLINCVGWSVRGVTPKSCTPVYVRLRLAGKFPFGPIVSGFRLKGTDRDRNARLSIAALQRALSGTRPNCASDSGSQGRKSKHVYQC
ncbi:MAG: hypothetical protein JXB35_15035 [Anaerolineae bacterium]|nr:hypothetical protein [Anaerolineae bacterium]